MALIDEVRFALRITTTTNTALNTELQRYIDTGKSDLVNTTNINDFAVDSATLDPLLKDALITYACFMFERDVTRKESYKRVYDDLKTKLMTSHVYSTIGGTGNEA